MTKKQIKNGQRIHGFIVRRIANIKDIQSIFYELEHEKTGARYIHLANRDTENGFCTLFKTIPQDSTGVAHILEHTVLTGSEKYPVRDPFFSMTRRSLNTFMNAFTSCDWTAYPFSSENEKDFYNLLDVYLDAAFFPNISELNFRQEGHRLEFNKDTGKLEFKGVVYNEMKGAMSSEDSIIAHEIQSALLPSGTYAYNSGGDPDVIPDLTHEQLKAFHARFYHPSNSYNFSYGNFPLEKHLEVVDRVLSRFEKIDPRAKVPPEPRWKNSKEMEFYYPLGKDEDPGQKYQAGLAWLTARTDEPFEVLSLEFLNEILLGDTEAPLYKALVNSGLGTSFMGGGFDDDYFDKIFVCGLKGIKRKDAKKVEEIIMDTLRGLAQKGINKELIAAAFNNFKISRKEISRSHYPYFISLFFRFASSWIHGSDPLLCLDSDKDMEKLDQKIKEGFLEKQIEKYFLNNKHMLSLLFVPDQEMNDFLEQQEQKRLARIEDELSYEDRLRIMKTAEDLEKLQDFDEDLSCLPTLSLSDIPVSVKTSKGVRLSHDAGIVRYKKPTNGLCYADILFDFDIEMIDTTVWPLFPIFCRALPIMGTKNFSSEYMVRLISRYTGGISAGQSIMRKFDSSRELVSFFSLAVQCLPETKKNTFDIIEELLNNFCFADLDKLKTIILQMKDRMEEAIVGNGHGFAYSLAKRGFDKEFKIQEMWSGVHNLKFLKELARDLDEQKLKNIAEDLVYLGRSIINREKMRIILAASRDQDIKELSELALRLKKNIPLRYDQIYHFEDFKQNNMKECWTTPTNVSFVADCFRVADMRNEDAPVLDVIAKVMKSCFIHKEIREKGGAYGGYAVYDKATGIFSFQSYRDPNISKTISVFREGAVEYICSGDFPEEKVKEAILQVCSVLDRPSSPHAEAFSDFYRRIIGLSDEARKEYKKRLLSVTRNDIIMTAKKYFTEGGFQNRSLAVISSDSKIEKENKKMSEPLEIRKI
ncbi:hypothetical protein A2331_06900 [Candidatus Falkowbacteria bacterium RIFOXYB2_FULL_34_18]|uniref:Peptidase M16C associated domain-containing protein n=1 Tax=Candidatus Falkowbacteria bacterium RIFOXYD2_FULL_34_120 TaxID=1798007 RepID=A0A1F5TRI2_9BACT|nr:MAG: hypothetical protein A2331_06900 [Candidatus Falkowbacteria bacterium RIFOXYB2_FULL_34_18]OGF29950.1 MAG: hypothetical protein A2500_03775 [Candidatus Falkowbacteria bacterium RIFOXYC12_FULL_34_55]OGF37192.1 MAG: hypothetical protein A2466_02740 [Candidatus Falkowbacteria bacterium RIFOXYC2_FULL_34_220]OGF39488.1 MAG: hypothetical protein A2515_04150 [Candidatus Falkowbacteria bacterium RIFOXYD12_FULL_34_57]OGF41530.1 MAG: hypothetical protein A2531_02455 [Candidatus Falkowbacteria bact